MKSGRALVVMALGLAGCAGLLDLPAPRRRAAPPPAEHAPPCDGGECIQCKGGDISCGGACVDATVDPTNCGRCGHACGPGGCTNGTCDPQVLVTDIPGSAMYMAFEGEDVVWAARGGLEGPWLAGRVPRLGPPCTGVDSRCSVALPEDVGVAGLAAEAEEVFLADAVEIYRLPADLEGPPEKIITAPSPVMVTRDGVLYYAAKGKSSVRGWTRALGAFDVVADDYPSPTPSWG